MHPGGSNSWQEEERREGAGGEGGGGAGGEEGGDGGEIGGVGGGGGRKREDREQQWGCHPNQRQCVACSPLPNCQSTTQNHHHLFHV